MPSCAQRPGISVKPCLPAFGFQLAFGVVSAVFLLTGCQRNSSTPKTDAPATDSAATQPKKDEPPVKPQKTSVVDELLNSEVVEKRPIAPPTFVRYQEVTSTFPDGRPAIRHKVKVMSDESLVDDGPYQEWYPSGEKYMEGNNVDGVREGVFKSWHENGKLCKEQVYKHGKLEGKWPVYRDDGTLEKEVSFKDDKRDGEWKYYDKTGKKLLTQEAYKGGSPEGVWKLWRENGTLARELQFRNGKEDGPLVEYFDGDQKFHLKHFKNGVADGEEIFWKANGAIARQLMWKDGQPATVSNPASPDKASDDKPDAKTTVSEKP